MERIVYLYIKRIAILNEFHTAWSCIFRQFMLEYGLHIISRRGSAFERRRCPCFVKMGESLC